ncbi:helix-turn-helix transcriptional regulator [Rheinheimera sp. NSM]
MAEGHFPKPVKLSARMVAWVEVEVQEWILARIGERDNAEYQNVN